MAHMAVERRSMDVSKWAKLNFDKVAQYIIVERYPIDGWEVKTGQYFPDGYLWEDDFVPIQEGDLWGGPDATCALRCNFSIPKELEGKEIWFHMLTSTEVLVSENGKYLDGLDPNRDRFKFTENAKAGEEHSLLLESYTRSKPDDDRNVRSNHMKGCVQTFKRPELVVVDHEMQSLKYDLDMIYLIAYGTYIDENVKNYMQHHIGELLKLFPLYECGREEVKSSLPSIKKYIDEKIYAAATPYGKIGKLACVAHSHLDIAYHWKVGQTVQKNARTTLIQLRLMDRYPEFTYAHTQAWTYETLEKYYPALFEELKAKVLEGRWEIVGGMYVEPDCNVVSAESLVRQILYGKLYFLEKFNINVDNCWLPDVFGNSAIMPQILKLGGIDYFVSNKMSTWNDTNLFPHNNFIWRGLDGTDIYACVPPVHFITWMDPNQAVENWERYQDKEACPESLQMYGYGDGGSGVTDEMLEYFKRQQKLPGVPEMRLTSGKEYLHSAFADESKMAVWDGNLYLEMHRGTFTTKADLKKYNRVGEFLAQETEALMTMASLAGSSECPEQKELQSPWKKLLLNQFHDILPGSHTAPVYTDAMETYGQMMEEFNSLKTRAIQCLTMEGNPWDYTAINPFSDIKGKLAYLDIQDNNIRSLADRNGRLYAIQKQVGADGSEKFCVALSGVSGFGMEEFHAVIRAADSIPSEMKIGKTYMENKFFRIELDDNGRISLIYDRIREREVTVRGMEANEWQLFEDCPGMYNAWDIIKTYKNHKIELPSWESVDVIENGPVSIALKLMRSFGKSSAVQIIRMFSDIQESILKPW